MATKGTEVLFRDLEIQELRDWKAKEKEWEKGNDRENKVGIVESMTQPPDHPSTQLRKHAAYSGQPSSPLSFTKTHGHTDCWEKWDPSRVRTRRFCQ